MLKLLGVYAQGVVAGGAYESIASVTAAGGESSLSFTSIPAGYQHLQIRGIYRDTNTAGSLSQNLFMRFNSDTGNNYAQHGLLGDGTNAGATGGASATYITIYYAGVNSSALASVFGVSITDIHDYASTSKNKTTRSFAGNDSNSGTDISRLALSSGLWMDTSAISSITLTPAASAFASGTTFALYGIKGA